MKNVTKKNTAAKAAQKTIASKPAESPEIVAHVERLEKVDAATKKPVSAAKAKRAVHAAVEGFVKEAAAKKTATKATAKPTPRKGATKTATIISMLERKGGATAADLLNATGWQAHSLRGFISGTLGKKMGRPAKSTVNAKGERVYSL